MKKNSLFDPHGCLGQFRAPARNLTARSEVPVAAVPLVAIPPATRPPPRSQPAVSSSDNVQPTTPAIRRRQTARKRTIDPNIDADTTGPDGTPTAAENTQPKVKRIKLIKALPSNVAAAVLPKLSAISVRMSEFDVRLMSSLAHAIVCHPQEAELSLARISRSINRIQTKWIYKIITMGSSRKRWTKYKKIQNKDM